MRLTFSLFLRCLSLIAFFFACVVFGEITPTTLGPDVNHPKALVESSAPWGFVTVLGADQLYPGEPAYDELREFSGLWTKQADHRIPLLTKDGGGANQAVSDGATQGRGPFLFGLKRQHAIPADRGVRFVSSSMRASALIDYARAIVVAKPDANVIWQLFEIITKEQTEQSARIPILLLGQKAGWQPMLDLLSHLVQLKTASESITQFVKVVPRADSAFRMVRQGIGMSADPKGPLPPLPKNIMPTHQQILADERASKGLFAAAAPNGFVAVFGGSRLKPGEPSYQLAVDFAHLWTARSHGTVPIGDGGGPGAMEAANKGATEAKGVSIGLIMSGLPGEKANSYINQGHAFRSFAFRESELIDRAHAAVFVRGGVGTMWEVFELLGKEAEGDIPLKPMVLLGSDWEWAPLLKLIETLRNDGFLPPHVLATIHHARTAEDAVNHLLNTVPKYYELPYCDLGGLAPGHH